MKKALGFLLFLTIMLTSCGSSRDIPLDELPDPQEYVLDMEDLPEVGEQWMPLACEDDLPGGGRGLKRACSIYFAPGPDFSSTDGITDTDVYSILSFVVFYKSPPTIWPLKPPTSMGDYTDLVWETIKSAPSYGEDSSVWQTTLTTEDGLTLPAHYLEFVKSGRRSIVTILIKGMPREMAEMTIFDLAGKIERNLPTFDNE